MPIKTRLLFFVAALTLVCCGPGVSTLRDAFKNFSDLIGSQVHRTQGAGQISIRMEKEAAGALAAIYAGYREVPSINFDDDGQDVSSPVIKIGGTVARPSATCGTTQSTIKDRIADCANLNGSSAKWSGIDYGIAGEGSWVLVTRTATPNEVWADLRTGLLWSGIADINVNWCVAAGNLEAIAPSCAATVASTCTEVAGLTANGADAKGNLDSTTTPAVRWRLPSINDWKQADIDGVRFVLPVAGNQLWSTTVVSSARTNAWQFNGDDGSTLFSLRNNTANVVCVGRAKWE